MADNTEKQPPEKEIKEKLKQLRTTYTNAKKLVGEIESTHSKFIELRDALADENNGAQTNLAWVAEQKINIENVLKNADLALSSLQTAASSIDAQIADMNTQYGIFQTTATKVFDETDGLQAIHDAAKKLRTAIGKYSTQSSKKVTDAQTHLDNIAKKTQAMTTAYDDFLVIKAKIDNTETGLDAQLRNATEYAKSALQAKTTAESELASVKAFKQESDELVGTIKDSRTEVDKYQKQSQELTDDIKNTLDKAASYSLSKALRDRTRGLNWQLGFWGFLSFLTIIMLILGVGTVFYALFFIDTNSSQEVAARLKDGPTLMSVLSKILFTAPLAYAVYFTTSNFSHVRDLRDKYGWKETVAKNLQTYVKTLKEEFADLKYEHARFNFVIGTVKDIYSEPNLAPKKRRYNIGVNRVFNLGLEEEDLKDFKSIIEDGVEEIVSDKVAESKDEETIESPDAIEVFETPKPTSPKKPKTNPPPAP